MFVSRCTVKQHLQPVAGPDPRPAVGLLDWWERHSQEESPPPIGQQRTHQSRWAESGVSDVWLMRFIWAHPWFYQYSWQDHMWIHPPLKIVPNKCNGRGGRASFVCLIFEVNIIFGVFIDILDETVDLYHHYRNSLTSHSESLLLHWSSPSYVMTFWRSRKWYQFQVLSGWILCNDSCIVWQTSSWVSQIMSESSLSEFLLFPRWYLCHTVFVSGLLAITAFLKNTEGSGSWILKVHKVHVE